MRSEWHGAQVREVCEGGPNNSHPRSVTGVRALLTQCAWA
jgi:hypothetical protein